MRAVPSAPAVVEARRPSVEAAGGAASANSGSPWAHVVGGAAAAAGPAEPTAKQAARPSKRLLHKGMRSCQQQAEIEANKMLREYSFYIRVAFAWKMSCPFQCYSAPDDMWRPLEPGFPLSVCQVCDMGVKPSPHTEHR